MNAREAEDTTKQTAPEHAHKCLLRDFVAALDADDLDGWDDRMGPAFQCALPACPVMDWATTKRQIGAVRRAFPDLRHEVEAEIGEGEWVAARLTARGHHTGHGLGVAPTGHPVKLFSVLILRVEGNRIAEMRLAYDHYDLLQQIGAAPGPYALGA